MLVVKVFVVVPELEVLAFVVVAAGVVAVVVITSIVVEIDAGEVDTYTVEENAPVGSIKLSSLA